MAEIDTFPFQVHAYRYQNGVRPLIPASVHMAAYEVYCVYCSPQKALTEGDARGGFSMGELIAFLYARSFPKEEWRQRVDEAFRGMKNY